MLMTILKGELAVRQSKVLIRAFKSMKDYIAENRDLTGANEILFIDCRSDDETLYHCVASSKDAGKEVTTIVRIDESSLYHSLIDSLLDNEELEIN